VSSSGHHGTFQALDYELTPTVTLCDFRGFEFKDDDAEKAETRGQINGAIKRGTDLTRNTDQGYWALTRFENFLSRLFVNKNLKLHYVILIISLEEFNPDTPAFMKVIEIITKEFKMKPLVVLTFKDRQSESTIKTVRSKLSEKIGMDLNYIMAIENYHFSEQDDPLEKLERNQEIERRMLKLLTIALQLGDDQLRLSL